MRPRDLLEKMAAEEDAFLRSSFVAPVVKGVKVRVRCAGVVWQFGVRPLDFEGWAVLRPLDHSRAEVVSEPGLKQVREYLDVFPAVPLVLCEKRAERWLGILAADAGPRIRLE